MWVRTGNFIKPWRNGLMKVENSKPAPLGCHGIELANYSILNLCLIIIKKISPPPSPPPTHIGKQAKSYQTSFSLNLKLLLGPGRFLNHKWKFGHQRDFPPSSKGRRAFCSQLCKKEKRYIDLKINFHQGNERMENTKFLWVDKFECCSDKIKMALR